MAQAKWILPLAGGVLLLLISLLWLTGTLSPQDQSLPAHPSPGFVVPSAVQTGEALFNVYCTPCHGSSAVGTEQGPSLLWKIYAPNHHNDHAFYQAVKQGVRAHHWRFGNMPAIPAVTEEDVAQIIAYVRWLQEQAGVR
jgi:mono/diheme cytochrome c family protein